MGRSYKNDCQGILRLYCKVVVGVRVDNEMKGRGAMIFIFLLLPEMERYNPFIEKSNH